MWTKKTTSEKWKFNSNKKIGLEWAVNGLRKPFRRKNLIQNNRKNSKNQSEIIACEQKTTTEKRNFCSNTIFSFYFKIRANQIHTAKALAFSLHFLFWRDQNHYSILTSKIMKIFEQILKNYSRKNSENALSGYLFKCHPTNHQKKRASNNLRLSWKKTIQQKSKKKSQK